MWRAGTLALSRRDPCGFVAVRRSTAVGSSAARMLMIPHKVSVVLMDALSGCSSRGCSLGVSVVLGEINKLPSPDMGVLITPFLRVSPEIVPP